MWITGMGYHISSAKFPQAVKLCGKWFPGETGEALSETTFICKEESGNGWKQRVSFESEATFRTHLNELNLGTVDVRILTFTYLEPD
jgi:hypothetical protein